MSFPSRGRGLKCRGEIIDVEEFHVVPLAGTWVEILPCAGEEAKGGVVPLAGTWVEITTLIICPGGK